jgi:hypothetical protein
MGEQRVADRPFFHVMNQITGSVVELDMRAGSNIMLRWWWWWWGCLSLSERDPLFVYHHRACPGKDSSKDQP